jgi:hypothetical protein
MNTPGFDFRNGQVGESLTNDLPIGGCYGIDAFYPAPRDALCMNRGQRGSLALHCGGLSRLLSAGLPAQYGVDELTCLLPAAI